MYREISIFNRYIKSIIVYNNYKLKTRNIKYRGDKIPHSTRHTSFYSVHNKLNLKPIKARGQILNIQQHGEVSFLIYNL